MLKLLNQRIKIEEGKVVFAENGSWFISWINFKTVWAHVDPIIGDSVKRELIHHQKIKVTFRKINLPKIFRINFRKRYFSNFRSSLITPHKVECFLIEEQQQKGR